MEKPTLAVIQTSPDHNSLNLDQLKIKLFSDFKVLKQPLRADYGSRHPTPKFIGYAGNKKGRGNSAPTFLSII